MQLFWSYWTSYIYLLIITNWKCPIDLVNPKVLEKLISLQSPIRWRACWGSSIMHQNWTLEMTHFSCNFVVIFAILSKLDQYMKIEQLTSMPVTTCKKHFVSMDIIDMPKLALEWWMSICCNRDYARTNLCCLWKKHTL